jgi:alkylation response protein AidB-like acyl-CoA dehydrogenase
MHHFSVAMILPVCQNPAGREGVLLQAIAQQNLLLASGFAEGESGRGALHPAMRASKTAQGVLVSGSKRPCSLSKSMNILTASALVYPDGAGEGRFAVLLIPAESAGIERRPFWKSPVLGAAESDELLLKDVFVPDRLVFYPERNVGENSLEGSGFLWFELLISAAYLGIASALAERVLTGNRGSAQDRVALVTELESAMSAIENVAHALGEGACGQREISRALFVRFGAQKAIERASALAFDLLGGMAFAGSPDAAYLYAAARALAFHPPSRLACTPSLDAFAMGGELRLE